MSRKATRKVIIVMLALSMLLVLTNVSFGETVITLAMRGGQNYVDGVKAALELYYKDHPGIRVDVIPDYSRD
jgi:ABC-type glycerol-3-phosphate transport system substrate-binding protein